MYEYETNDYVIKIKKNEGENTQNRMKEESKREKEINKMYINNNNNRLKDKSSIEWCNPPKILLPDNKQLTIYKECDDTELRFENKRCNSILENKNNGEYYILI